MSHPYASKIQGRKTAVKRYALGGGEGSGSGPFPGQTEKDFVEGERSTARRKIMSPDPMGGYAGDSVKDAYEKEKRMKSND